MSIPFYSFAKQWHGQQAGRTLKRPKTLALQHLMFHSSCLGPLTVIPLLQLRLKPCQILRSPACVGHDVERVLCVFRDEGIVDNTASFIEEYGKSGGIWCERSERGRGKPFKKCECGLSTEAARLIDGGMVEHGQATQSNER